MNEHYENGVVVFSEPITSQQVENINNGMLASRRAAYITESDPLFFKAQRGEATMQDWTAKVEEIKARFPVTQP